MYDIVEVELRNAREMWIGIRDVQAPDVRVRALEWIAVQLESALYTVRVEMQEVRSMFDVQSPPPGPLYRGPGQ